MSEYDFDINKWLYPISYVLNKAKFNSLLTWLNHRDMQQSKLLGWKCELCGSKSKPKERYKHSLIQRVRWHINATYKNKKGEIVGRCEEQYKRRYDLVVNEFNQ